MRAKQRRMIKKKNSVLKVFTATREKLQVLAEKMTTEMTACDERIGQLENAIADEKSSKTALADEVQSIQGTISNINGIVGE